MQPYYCIFAFIALLACMDILYVKSQQKHFFMFLLWCVLALFAGLRMNTPDWDGYSSMYKEVASGASGGFADRGFEILCRILSIFSSNSIVMFLVVASVATALNLSSFRKYSPYFFICVLCYFVHIYVLKEMIQIRTGLASAICIYGIRYLAVEKYKRFLFLLCIAFSIHFSAVIYLLFFLSLRSHLEIKTLKIILLISLVIGLFFPLGQYLKQFAGGIDERLSAYIAYGDSGYAGQLGVFTNLNTVKSLIVLTVIFVFYDRLNVQSIYFKPIVYSYTLGVCWLIAFNDFAIIAARMSNILLSVEPILISYLFTLFTVKSRWIVLFVVIYITYMMLILNMAPDKVTPYQFYFS